MTKKEEEQLRQEIGLLQLKLTKTQLEAAIAKAEYERDNPQPASNLPYFPEMNVQQYPLSYITSSTEELPLEFVLSAGSGITVNDMDDGQGEGNA